MNKKFFQLPLQKRQRMMNAAYKVFAQNSYQKAPMSAIAEEGGVSKALLFHYFTNKAELYMFVWNSGIEQIRKASREYHVADTTDFFEMLRRSLLAKCSVIRSYPHLYQFAAKAYYEQEPEIRFSIQGSYHAVREACEDILWKTADVSPFRQDIDARLAYQEILWACDGYLRQMMASGKLDAGQMEKDFEKMIGQWRKAYFK